MSTSAEYRQYVEPNRRVLIVDDNPAIHEDFHKTLSPRGSARDELAALEDELFGDGGDAQSKTFELTSAYQGAQGLELALQARAEGRPFALAFIDVRMPPGMDGIETTARLLAEEPEINIVVCSAYSDHSWEEMIETIGETDRVLILKKPFDTIEVRQLAHAMQRRWDLSRLVELKLEDLTAAVDARTRELETANSRLTKEIKAREEALALLAESNERIRALAYQDGLTGLPNRRLLNEHLDKVLARSRRKNTEFAVLFIDLDNFKVLNDTLGHQAADTVLKEFSESLTDLIRSEDVLAVYMDQETEFDATTTISMAPITDSVLSRLGGDEFVILLPEIKDRFSAGTVANRILSRLEQPFIVSGNEAFLTASIGIATYPEDGETSEALIRNADAAMYHAKQQGKAAFQYFSAELNEASAERIRLENGLKKVMQDGLLELHYQPQIDVTSGRIVGAEALVRWNDEIRGFIAPETFVPIAEDAGLIFELGEWVIETACRQAVEWQRAGLPPVPVSVNVSAIQFRRQDLAELIESVLAKTGLDASMLCLDISERTLASVRDRAHETLRRLREADVSVALDDFGMGQSSLNDLRSFPLDALKIDRSFIAEMLTDPAAASVTEAIVSMGRIMGLTVVAEGIETEPQLEFISRLGCKTVQGFHFSEALPADGFARLLAESLKTPMTKPPKPRKLADG